MSYFLSPLASLFPQIRDAQLRADRIYEPMVGLVVDNKDPEKMGRIKVKFPTLPDPDLYKTWWAPLVPLGGGKDRGWWFLPEIDDEVLVVFEHGDIERPFVIGALWNGKDLPPEKNEGENERRVIQSREGSRVTFDDKNETLTFEDGDKFGAKITLDAKNNQITFEARSGDVCIQCPKGEMKIVAATAQLTATSNVHLIAKDGVAIGANATATIGGGRLIINSNTSMVEFNKAPPRPPVTTKDECEDVPDPVP